MSYLKTVFLSVLLLSVSLSAKTLTVVGWGGSYGESSKKRQVDPFGKKSGHTMLMEDYSGGIAKIKAQVESKNVTWDVVDLEGPDFFRACDEGLLEKLPLNELPKGSNGKKWDKDFIENATSECGVGNIVWAIVAAYNTKAFKGSKPKTIKDFFDLKKYPGKRGLRKSPQATLEWALVADGVKVKDVFKVLSTKKGVDRAFKKLDTIKKQVVWFDSWSLAPKMLADGEVNMIQSANGRIYTAYTNEKKPFKIIWDAQYYDFDYWGIPKGSKNKKEAIEFIKFATQSKILADVSNDVAYGATRDSSSRFINKKVLSHLPSYKKNMKTAIFSNAEFWMDNKAELDERFNAWLLK